MSLRARLALVTVAVAAVGLVAVSIVVPRLVRGFLVDRLDQQIRAMQAPATGALLGDRRTEPGFGRGPVDFSGVYAVLLDASGKTVAQGFLRTPANPVQPPRLPDASEWTMGSRFNVGSRGTGRAVAYRVRVDGAPGGGTLAVAVPLTDVNDTIGRLIFVEVIVGAVALAAVAALAWWLTGVGLRPLRRIEDTAESIAATGLGQRIQETSPRTEVGRLGRSLNTMLGRIEDAFARQAATEATLRRFVADASHELRTPLTSIRGYAELYHRGGGAQAEQVERSMTRIEEEALRMSDLVDDLLLLARLDEGRPLDREPVDLADVAAKVVADARAVEPGREISLAAPAPVVVEGDQARLIQVAANLVGNTRVHTPPGSAIEVRVKADAEAGRLEVEDHGPGLTKDQAEQVFSRFYRVDPARTHDHGGAGLGLSIVAAITRAHGGHASVTTRPGRGATFSVTFPLLRRGTLASSGAGVDPVG